MLRYIGLYDRKSSYFLVNNIIGLGVIILLDFIKKSTVMKRRKFLLLLLPFVLSMLFNAVALPQAQGQTEEV